MNRFLVILLLSSLTINWANTQVALQNEAQVKLYKAIPQEHIFTHINTSLFLTGEYIYYNVYCFDNKTANLSDLSKIAYVELISEKGEQLFKQKIKLNNGLGNGDFFIPVTAQTGSYKLLAYTNWMKNEGIDRFFKGDLHIINPYQAQKTNDRTAISKSIDTIINSNHKTKEVDNIDKNAGPLDLVLSNQISNTRSKISMILKSKNEATIPYGAYSISVRKTGKIPEPSKQRLVTYLQNITKKVGDKAPSNNISVYLPELRGELLRGMVSTSSNSTLKDLKIAASIPGENFYIALAKTDKNGNFYINIDKDYEGNRIFLEILDASQHDYKIALKEQASLDYSRLVFEDLTLDSLMKKEILQRSIHNQIDNAYFKYKPDSILATVSEQLFDSKEIQSYKLDDFTRFKTVRETIFEIVKDVSISNMKKSNALMRVQGYNYGTNSGILPLVLIDGLQISNHSILLDRNAFTIEEIDVFRDRFVLGPKVYQGALIFTSKNNNIEEFQNNPSLFSFNLLKPQVSKNYFQQQYNETTPSRIPDDRLQLLWIPHLKITKNESILDFFTSDVTGEFEISIEGFTSQQEPVSIQRYFSVQN